MPAAPRRCGCSGWTGCSASSARRAAAAPAEAEPVDVDQGLFRPSPDDALVELELSAAGRWVAEYYPCE